MPFPFVPERISVPALTCSVESFFIRPNRKSADFLPKMFTKRSFIGSERDGLKGERDIDRERERESIICQTDKTDRLPRSHLSTLLPLPSVRMRGNSINSIGFICPKIFHLPFPTSPSIVRCTFSSRDFNRKNEFSSTAIQNIIISLFRASFSCCWRRAAAHSRPPLILYKSDFPLIIRFGGGGGGRVRGHVVVVAVY